MLPYAAYLRAYQPLAAYPPQSRAYWLAYARSPHRPRRIDSVAAEHADSLRRAVATPASVAPRRESQHAYVRTWQGEVFVCPWQTRLRSWLAFRDFHATTPRQLLPDFLPGAALQEAWEGFENWRKRGEGANTQILTSTWSIPIPWFSLFDADERCLIVDSKSGVESGGAPSPRSDFLDKGAPSTRALLYVTSMSEARRRVSQAVRFSPGNDPYSNSADDGTFLAPSGRLEEWLHAWHPRSLVELDYGGLVWLLTDEQLYSDHSVAEAAAAIQGLRKGEREMTLAMYQRLRLRWRAIRALQRAN